MPVEPKILKEIKQKSRERRKKLLTKALATVLILLGFVIILILVTRTTLIDVKTVVVKDVDGGELEYVEREAVLSAVEERVVGQNLFSVDVKDTQMRVRGSDPFVEAAYIEKNFPSRITINIAERKPFLLVDSTVNCYLIDAEGFVLIREFEEGEEEESADNQSDGEADAQEDNHEVVQQESMDCDDIKSTYPVVVVDSNEIKADFPLGEQSTFYEVSKIELFTKVLKDYGYTVSSIEIVDGIYLLHVGDDKIIVFSDSQDEEIQLKRFILVANKIDEEGLDFRTLDLRYKRPVLKRL